MDGRNDMGGHNGQKGLNSFTLGFGDDYHGQMSFKLYKPTQLARLVLDPTGSFFFFLPDHVRGYSSAAAQRILTKLHHNDH